MDIEYQKNEVTWCLDRDGPRICLRAVSINDELQHLQISSESFSLDLKTTEAQEFLSILKDLAVTKKPSIPISKAISPDIVKEISDEIFEEKFGVIPTISPSNDIVSIKPTPSFDTAEILEVLQKPDQSVEKEVDESQIEPTPSPHSPELPKPSSTLDTAEILDVLKQSEIQEEEEPVKVRRLGSLFGVEESATLTPSTDISEESEAFKQSDGKLENEITKLTDILIGKEEPDIETYETPTIQSEPEETIDGISGEENLKPSVVLGGRVDTASFFQEAVVKSPLEQLLEEGNEEEEPLSSEPTTTVEEPAKTEVDDFDKNHLDTTKDIAPYSPEDLQSSSFVSDFNSKIEEMKSEFNENETQESSSISSENDLPEAETIIESTYTTEAERKKQIEKEREARKKRLWELTRGF